MTPWWANFTALLLTAIANTAANRRFTFGVRGPRDVVRHQLQGLAIFAAGLAATTGSLWLLHALTSPSRGAGGRRADGRQPRPSPCCGSSR